MIYKKNDIKYLDLSKAPDCRYYLEHVFVTVDGKKVSVAGLTDSEIIKFANQIYDKTECPPRKERTT